MDAPVTSVPVTDDNSFGKLDVPECESVVEVTPFVDDLVV